jgi:hypothetical protein
MAMEIYDQEELERRGDHLGTLNGIELIFVELDETVMPPVARLTVEFFNGNILAAIVDDVQNNAIPPTTFFHIRGGRRVVGGENPGEIQVTDVEAVAANDVALRLTVEPLGDYSTYVLEALHPDIDEIFRRKGFKFRPGCFNLNCRPDRMAPPAPAVAPGIDYLSRDYHSFKHLLIAAMMERVPGWQPTSEADLDQVLIGLLAAQGDELADLQDRAANEAYFGRARKRVSLARHARLVDYHIHQGNQATTWIAIEVIGDSLVSDSFSLWTSQAWSDPEAEIFKAKAGQECFALLNALALYTWGGLVTALDAGATEADLALPAALDPTQEAEADILRDVLRQDAVHHLLLEEKLNPETGREAGRDRTQRQLLRLVDGDERALTRFDALNNRWMVRVRWRPEDALRNRFCFVTRCEGEPPEEEVCLFHGNLLEASHGRPHLTLFVDPERPLDTVYAAALDAERDAFALAMPWGRISEASYDETPWGRVCPLPEGPLAYRNTPPGGERPPESTLAVGVEGIAGLWDEQIDLIESQADDNDYIVETDESGFSQIRFGRVPNGEPPPAGTYVAARYQVGRGSRGNVGADSLTGFDVALFPAVRRAWNPFDAVDGRDPEAAEVIRRRAPEAYRARQLRAVTLEDYRKRAEELPFVQRAHAAYGWTGSWRTVRITLDPLSSTALTDAQIEEAGSYLNAVRLIGEDLEIRPPILVPLDIKLAVCAHPSYWPEDLTWVLEEEFSDGYTSDGRLGFFHPNNWTFGQTLHASQVIGRALEVPGIDRVIELSLRRFDQAGGPTNTVISIDPDDLPTSDALAIAVGDNEIINVANDPSHLELGRMQIDVMGGRR